MVTIAPLRLSQPKDFAESLRRRNALGKRQEAAQPVQSPGRDLLNPFPVILLDAQALQKGFAAWAASMRGAAREVIAVDGKTLRGSKMSSDGTGALHLVSAYATGAGLVLAQRAVEGKSNEITAIPELLDMASAMACNRS